MRRGETFMFRYDPRSHISEVVTYFRFDRILSSCHHFAYFGSNAGLGKVEMFTQLFNFLGLKVNQTCEIIGQVVNSKLTG